MNGMVPGQMGGVGNRRASADTIVLNRRPSGVDTMTVNRRLSAETIGVPGQIGGVGNRRMSVGDGIGFPGLMGGVGNRRMSAEGMGLHTGLGHVGNQPHLVFSQL